MTDPSSSYHFDKLTAEEIHPYLQSYILEHMDLDDQPLDEHNNNRRRMIKTICARCGIAGYSYVKGWRDLFIDNHYDPFHDSFAILCKKCNKQTYWNDFRNRIKKYGVSPIEDG